MNPELDGIDHINVYSRGKTALGRQLSNFASTPFKHPTDGDFLTVEGWWYWTMTGFDALRELEGWECKQLGLKANLIRTHPTEEELIVTYRAKLDCNPDLKIALEQNRLPLEHYYVYGGKVVIPKEWQWTAKLWEKL